MASEHPYSLFCDEICCSDFIRFQDQTEPSVESDLAYPIAKIFNTADLFSVQEVENGPLRPLSPGERGNMDMALRLASQMLHDDRTAHYIVTMHDGLFLTEAGGEAKPFNEIIMSEMSETAKLPRTFPPRFFQHRLTRQAPETIPSGRSKVILDNLSELLTTVTLFPMPPGVYGATGWQPQSHLAMPSQAARQKFPWSLRNVSIRLNMRMALSTSWSERYRTARTLVHEVAHALEKAVHGSRFNPVFYHDGSTDELGYELENLLFGGPYDTFDLQEMHPAATERYVQIRQHWPSAEYIKRYASNPLVSTPKINLRSDLPPMDDYFVVSRMPFDFMRDMSKDSFWASRRSPSGQRMPCKILPDDDYRWVMRCTGNQKYRPCSPSDPNLPPRIQQVFDDIRNEKRRRVDGKVANFAKPPPYVWRSNRWQQTARDLEAEAMYGEERGFAGVHVSRLEEQQI